MPQHAPSLVPGQEHFAPAHPRTARPGADVTAADPSPFPRRIVFLARRDLGNPAAGGSELLVDRVAGGLTAAGHQVTLLCGGPAAYRDYRVVSAGGDAGHFLRARRAYARQVGDCDLLVEVCNGMPYLAPLWHKGPTLCLVNHVHTDLWDMRYPGPVARLGRRLEHWALSGSHRDSLMVAVSDSTAAALRGIGVAPERIRVVHNGVEDPGPLLPKSAEPLFVAVGRLVEYKRIDLLLRLWERVRPVTGGRLVIVGDGPERERLEAMAGPDVVFTGRVSEAEKHRLLCEAWLLLHPSLVEGWGLVVTEAAARATPAVGFDIPGLRDSVVDGVTGVLAGGESSFAAAWCSLALSQERRSIMGRAAQARAEQFRWSSTVRQFGEVAAEACGMGGPTLAEAIGKARSMRAEACRTAVSEPAEGYGTSRSTPAEIYGTSRSTPAEAYRTALSTPPEDYDTTRSTPAEIYGTGRSTPTEAYGTSRSTPTEAYRTALSTPPEDHDTTRSTPAQTYGTSRSTPTEPCRTALSKPAEADATGRPTPAEAWRTALSTPAESPVSPGSPIPSDPATTPGPPIPSRPPIPSDPAELTGPPTAPDPALPAPATGPLLPTIPSPRQAGRHD